MPKFFTMRLVAPIATIRGPIVGDARYPAQCIPSSSMVVGMIGAALGIERREHRTLQRIQDAISEIAWLVHREPHIVADYQTTDLSKPHMRGPMWAHDPLTNRVWTETRAGGDATRTLVSERDLTSDVDLTCIVSYEPEPDLPDPKTILAALDRPAMPLSIGARWALPAEPVAGSVIEGATTLVEAASHAKATLLAQGIRTLRVYLPARTTLTDVGHAGHTTPLISITASRDWRTRRHVGSALYSVSAGV
jgi:hypothetical protein